MKQQTFLTSISKWNSPNLQIPGNAEKKIIAFLLAFMLAIVSFAQVNNIDKILSALNGSEVFKSCLVFKKDMNDKMAKVKTMTNIDPEKFNSLRLAYTDVYEKYDVFLKTVKLDLSNLENLKNLARNPESAAQNYATAYQAVKESYENNFLLQFNNLQSDGSKGLPLIALLKFGFDAFKLIANSIKSHRIDKDQAINLILPVLNEKLFNKLKLDTWSQLDLPPPGGYVKNEAVIIPAKTINSLAGSIRLFVRDNSTNADRSLPLILNEGKKDLVVVSDNDNAVSAAEEYFITSEAFPMGTKFRIEVVNSGFTYVLALNTNGIALIFPNKNLSITKTSDTKDITIVGDETPATGLVNIPDNDVNGNHRYFAISRNATGVETKTEELAVILSKSELELEEIIEKLNTVTGNLSERITQVFGEQKIKKDEGQVSLQGEELQFNASDSMNNVLPLVFKILKQ